MHACRSTLEDPTAYLAGAYTLAWTATFGSPISGPVTVASNVVYVGTEDGHVYAMPVGCAATCLPTWVGNAVTGSLGAGAIRGGVAVNDGGVFAVVSNFSTEKSQTVRFAVGCATGGATCVPTDSSNVFDGTTESTPSISGGRVFFTVSRISANLGDLYALRARCLVCIDWKASDTTGFSLVHNSPAVARGIVYASWDYRLRAYPVSCSTPCSPLWTTAPGEVGPGGPAVAGDLVYAESISGGQLNVYDARCSTNPCPPRIPVAYGQSTGSYDATPTVLDGRVYLTRESGIVGLALLS